MYEGRGEVRQVDASLGVGVWDLHDEEAQGCRDLLNLAGRSQVEGVSAAGPAATAGEGAALSETWPPSKALLRSGISSPAQRLRRQPRA